jgi:short-subunit dehydrogenase
MNSADKQTKTVWITGASSGIGEALVKRLDQAGYHVIASARNADKLQGLEQQGRNITALAADLCQQEDLSRVKSYFSNHPLDCVILNAGTCEYMDEGRLDIASMRRVYDLNLFAAVDCIEACRGALSRSGNGHIIGVSSMSVYLPFARAEYYASSKAALGSYLDSLAIDLKANNIDVTTVYPGFVKTPLTDKNTFPMPMIISAEEAADNFIGILNKRPRHAAFPRPMHYLLKTLQKLPFLWRHLHQAAKPNTHA